MSNAIMVAMIMMVPQIAPDALIGLLSAYEFRLVFFRDNW